MDLLYVAGIVAFFALMFAYVSACERLGGPADDAEGKS
ncbi:MAG: potassium ABC transporter ATPase [Phycisphaerae bacterium]|nr:potassium ABC transporter ATPase [Gemmatimonadaceae bacterium]